MVKPGIWSKALMSLKDKFILEDGWGAMISENRQFKHRQLEVKIY